MEMEMAKMEVAPRTLHHVLFLETQGEGGRAETKLGN